MRAVDTNILARYYLRDDVGQARIAAAVLARGDIFVPKTVIYARRAAKLGLEPPVRVPARAS